MRVAALDCGTNSVKLLVADLDPATGTQTQLVRELRMTRLGQDVDRTGLIGAAALRRTFRACDDYAETVRQLGAERVRCCATSAARDAGNLDQLGAGIRARFGVDVEVLTGEQEATLSYRGVARGLRGAADGADEVGDEGDTGPLLVVDIGGGSTELVMGRANRVLASASADVGSVRLTERHLAADPPTAAQREAAVRDADAALAAVPVPLSDAGTVVGVSGTAVTVAAHALGLQTLDDDLLHGARVRVDRVRASCRALLAATVAQRLALAVMHPGRADVIGGGAVVLDRVMVAAGAGELVVSVQDLLDGIAWSLLGQA